MISARFEWAVRSNTQYAPKLAITLTGACQNLRAQTSHYWALIPAEYLLHKHCILMDFSINRQLLIWLLFTIHKLLDYTM